MPRTLGGSPGGVSAHFLLYGADAHNHSLEAETAQNAIRLMEWFAAAQLDILAKGRRASAQKLEEEYGPGGDRQDRQRLDYLTARHILRAPNVPTAVAAHALLSRINERVLVGEDVTPPHGGKTTRIFR